MFTFRGFRLLSKLNKWWMILKIAWSVLIRLSLTLNDPTPVTNSWLKSAEFPLTALVPKNELMSDLCFRTTVTTQSCITPTTSGCHFTSSSSPSSSTCRDASGSWWRAASWSSLAREPPPGLLGNGVRLTLTQHWRCWSVGSFWLNQMFLQYFNMCTGFKYCWYMFIIVFLFFQIHRRPRWKERETSSIFLPQHSQ